MNSLQNKSQKLFKDNLAIFGIFYLTALWLEIAEGGETPQATFISLILLLAIIFTGIDRLKFCCFIALNTVYFLYFCFTNVNHINLILCGNIGILAIAFESWLRPNKFPRSRDYYSAIASYCRICLITVYFWMGFHKLNIDFFRPQYSCSKSIVLGMIKVLNSSILGIPTFLLLVGISFIFLQQVIPQNFWSEIAQNKKYLFFFSLISLAFFSILIKLLFVFEFTRFIFPLLVLTISILMLLWELVGSIVLFIPEDQIVMLLFSILIHLVLSLIGFVSFSSLAFTLWLTFIPQNYYPYLNQPVKIALTNLTISRPLLYVAINIFGGLLSIIYYSAYPNFQLKEIANLLFIISVLITITPLVKKFLIAPNSWSGVTVINLQMPRLMYVPIVLLFLSGATPYLGLSTASNFAMFSNLSTEGLTSNHLLLSNNPLKIWNYQEDIVKIIEIDDKKAKVGYKYRPLKNHYLPLVEFKKLIYKWTKANYTVPLVFKYRDRAYTTTNIVNDPVWRTPKLNWEMMLLDFRAIQSNKDKPSYCRL
jgi:hypothetical protein